MSLRQSVLSKGIPPIPSSGRGPPTKDFSPLPWDQFFDRKTEVKDGCDVFNVYIKGSTGPIFFCLHGGGYSGTTWGCLAERLCQSVDCRVVAPDLRGHGSSKSPNEENLSKEQQIKDISVIFNGVMAQFEDGDGQPPVCVIGHSMGGALAVHVVHAGLIANVLGLIVIDVVEGSAMDALTFMQTFLRNRPHSFPSEEQAIKWCLSSGTAKNSKAARVSMPSQLVKQQDDTLSWRVDLSKTADHWPGWFQGLSQDFLSCNPPKLLVLAGVDRLDKDLTIGQMQGKFQTSVLPRVGHAIQEDSPDQLADEVANFAVRYRFCTFKEGKSLGFPRRLPMQLGTII